MPRPPFVPLLALLAGCGHLSNDTMEADAGFLAALPDRARQALAAPDEATAGRATEGEARMVTDTLWPDDRPDTHARTAEAAFAWAVAPPDVTDPAGAEPEVDPEGGSAGLPQWSEVGGDGHGGAALPDDLPRLSPVSQSREAFTTLGEAFDQVFDAADLLRASAPTEATADRRGWESVGWLGGHLDATMTVAEGADYAWAMSGADGAVFLDGEHAGWPTVETGTGAFRFDQAAWATAFGHDAHGVVAVTYDNRAGVALELALDGVSYADSGATCGGAEAVRTGLVDLGPRQRYRRDDAGGDYQFVTTRGQGCHQEARSEVRVRWDDGGGRADAVVFVGPTTRWRWTQCWTGALDPDALSHESVVLQVGLDAPREAWGSGDEAACRFTDFARVDEALRSGDGEGAPG